MVQHVRDRRAEGVRHFQLKLGADPREDAARVRAVLEEDLDVVVADANGGWRLQDAVIAARALEGLDCVLFEQPCPTLEECLVVRERTTLPMVLDEVITDAGALIRAYGAMEGINLKIGRVGGLTKARLIRDLGTELGLRFTIEDSWGGDVTTAAVSHLAASTRPEALLMASFMNDWTLEHVAGQDDFTQTSRSFERRKQRGRRSAHGLDLDQRGRSIRGPRQEGVRQENGEDQESHAAGHDERSSATRRAPKVGSGVGGARSRRSGMHRKNRIGA
jgi:L-alanine-DL-glutamate epimerase-like enolase superfamily enzyme